MLCPTIGRGEARGYQGGGNQNHGLKRKWGFHTMVGSGGGGGGGGEGRPQGPRPYIVFFAPIYIYVCMCVCMYI